MRRLLKLLIAPVAITLISFAITCSDDNGTGPGEVDIESLMRTQISQDMDAIMSSIIFGFNQFDGFDEPGVDDIFSKRSSAVSPEDTVYYEYTVDGWHVLYMEQDTIISEQDSYLDFNIILSDSVQFMEGQTVVQNPDANTDYLQMILWLEAMLDIQVADTGLTLAIDQYHIDCIFEKQLDGDVLVNGDLNLDYTVTAVQGAERGTGSVLYSIAVANVELTQPYGCPAAGVISADLSVDFQGSAGEADGDWSVTVTFLGNNQARVQISGPNANLDFTESFECGDVTAASPIPFNAFIPSNQ
ncbi:MAG TPA: hypothetical protein ENO22_10635 [candidate division Zixibacteria bacterium]|nr:hypothetical protein [candidate division Zixibacteria bacterium]